MDYENIAKQILQHIGGKENVATVIHCMTRLRFTLKNEAIANDEAVKNTKGVVGVMKKAGQYQIIIGNDVGNVYDELCKLGDFSNSIPIPKKQEVLKNKNINNENDAYITHHKVGQAVRQTIKRIGGTMPEDLPTPRKSTKQIEKEKNKKLSFKDNKRLK